MLFLRSLIASPLMKPFLTLGGWHELKFVYWKVEKKSKNMIQILMSVKTWAMMKMNLPFSVAYRKVEVESSELSSHKIEQFIVIV